MVVEQKEPHVGRMAFAELAQPASFAERCEFARRMRDELEVSLPIFVDGMDDASRALFSDLPSPAFVIDRVGRIVDKLPWADPEALAARIASLLADDPLPADHAAAWTLDERDAIARRLLALGRAAEARRWLTTDEKAGVIVPQTRDATARIAIARVAAMRGAEESAWSAAIAAAHDALAEAWPDDAGRRVAARVELAEAAAGSTAAVDAWRRALADLEARAPALTRAWLEARLAAAEAAARAAGGTQARR